MRKVITLCGSTKFKNEFIDVNKWLTLTGNVVITCSIFAQVDGDPITDDDKELLDKIHKSKIDLADDIFVIDVNEYIGNSTKSEIDYAISNGKGVRYLSKEKKDFESWLYKYQLRKLK